MIDILQEEFHYTIDILQSINMKHYVDILVWSEGHVLLSENIIMLMIIIKHASQGMSQTTAITCQ